MDSGTLLDYALFQLTPTRTRCELVVVSGKKSEKVASGLVEPFIAHLKYTKDQISKGGYSIKLLPPATDDASWFTKGTFQRFVRFVSTPEILEAVVRIEREISHIETAIQSNEVLKKEVTEHPGEGTLSAADEITKKLAISSKSSSDEGLNGAAPEENSRICLQRVMVTRKVLLQKEQAMAYARAVVAGYEMDTIDDLIFFADTFGATRLREACIDFKELYKQKHSDDQWMDELAAMQASAASEFSYVGAPGILLAGENIHGNGISVGLSESLSDLASTPISDGVKASNLPAPEQTPQPPVQWMNQVPQYLYNFQGYPFPGMQPYYPGQMGWPSPGGIVPQSKNGQNKKPLKKTEKSVKGNETSEEDGQTESSDSYSGTDSEDVKETDRKPSSKGQRYVKKNRHSGEENEISDGSSGGAFPFDEDSIREGVDIALAKARKSKRQPGIHVQNGSNYDEQDPESGFDTNISGGKISSTWDAFQNLLMSHEEPTSNGASLDFESENIKKQPLNADDSVLAIQRGGCYDGTETSDFMSGENSRPSTKKKVSQDVSAMFSRQSEESRTSQLGTLADFAAESSVMKNQKDEDWFVANSSQVSRTRDIKRVEFNYHDTAPYEGSFVQKETAIITPVVDDSFMIQSRSAVDEPYVSDWKTDISMVSEVEKSTHPEIKDSNISRVTSLSNEPDDICMVLVRESQDSTWASWTPEMDYQLAVSFTEADKKSPTVEANGHMVKGLPANGKSTNGKKTLSSLAKNPRALAGSLVKTRSDPISKIKKTASTGRSAVQKSKFEKEEEERRRKEELVLERQKRIAERTASRGSTPAAAKKIPVAKK
ncbi:dentin sialophosphoprotein-like [Dorcoceras hygrometricum]|uniref:Dentin sialophosphoprotein-like n=1 Tax=Dorcoceras hygrometricum TaxID=472368 RepID=A0A2Z7BY18_9LAMI|nr:dentin sialophosphoprotein-like [Dorcoceras hygrometricum]